MLQSTVKKTMGIGNAGEIYKAENSFLNLADILVTDLITKVGTFVQKGTNDGEAIMASGRPISTSILGVVVKDGLRESSTETDLCKQGDNYKVLNEGNIFISATGTITQGSHVFLKNSDGSLAFNASKTLADHTYTGFRVDIGNASGAGIIGITTANA
jgi:hypothetical protein